MRFNLPSPARAKSFAQDLHHHLPGAKLSALQHLAARVYGYADWHELMAQAGTHAASPWDAEDGQLTYDRHQHQTRCLEEWLGSSYEDAASKLLQYLTPTSAKARTPCEGVALVSARDNPGLALAQSRLLPRGSYVDDWMESTRLGPPSGDVPGSFDEVKEVPPEVRAILTQGREWGAPVWEKTPEGVVQRVWFRRAGLYRGALTWAAVWRWEVEGAAAAKAPSVRCHVEFLWAAPATALFAHALGSQVAHVRWRQMLAHWTPEIAAVIHKRDHELAQVPRNRLSAFMWARMREDPEGEVVHVPPPLELHLVQSDLSLPTLLTVCHQANYERQMFVGDGDGPCMRVTLGDYAFLAGDQKHNVLGFGPPVRSNEGSELDGASRAVLVGDPQGSDWNWRVLGLERAKRRKFGEMTAGPGSVMVG